MLLLSSAPQWPSKLQWVIGYFQMVVVGYIQLQEKGRDVLQEAWLTVAGKETWDSCTDMLLPLGTTGCVTFQTKIAGSQHHKWLNVTGMCNSGCWEICWNAGITQPHVDVLCGEDLICRLLVRYLKYPKSVGTSSLNRYVVFPWLIIMHTELVQDSFLIYWCTYMGFFSSNYLLFSSCHTRYCMYKCKIEDSKQPLQSCLRANKYDALEFIKHIQYRE